MQRHSKILQTKVNARAVVTALICVAFLLIGSVVSAYAITPPDYTGSPEGFTTQPTSEHATYLTATANMQDALGSFNAFTPVLLAWRSNNVRLYVVRGSYTITNDGTNISISYSETNWAYGFVYFTPNGFFNIQSTTTTSFPVGTVISYRTTSDAPLTQNSAYSPGTYTNGSVVSAYNAWKTYYDKVINYDTNLQNATNAGFAQGQLVGRVEGREEGYETGYDEGYDDGYDGGYEEGSNVGYQNGLTQGREEGYETGYDEGEQYGYEVGYREGQDYTYPIAYQEGYDDGYEQGASIGGAPSVSYELDVGSIISALPQAARNIIDGALGFEIFGINVAGTLTAILVVAIVGFVVKWLLSLKS